MANLNTSKDDIKVTGDTKWSKHSRTKLFLTLIFRSLINQHMEG